MLENNYRGAILEGFTHKGMRFTEVRVISEGCCSVNNVGVILARGVQLKNEVTAFVVCVSESCVSVTTTT